MAMFWGQDGTRLWLTGVLCACVHRRRARGSEFRLWACVICVGGGIWAGERNLCMRGRGRVCEMTHIFQPVGGFICWG